MVCTFLKVYMDLGSYFLFLQEQIKDIINSRASATSCPTLLMMMMIKDIIIIMSNVGQDVVEAREFHHK